MQSRQAVFVRCCLKKAGFLIILAGIFLVNGSSLVSGGNKWGLFCGGMSAVIFSALLLGEKMSALQIAGAVCIIGGAMFGKLVKFDKNQKTGENV